MVINETTTLVSYIQVVTSSRLKIVNYIARGYPILKWFVMIDKYIKSKIPTMVIDKNFKRIFLDDIVDNLWRPIGDE